MIGTDDSRSSSERRVHRPTVQAWYSHSVKIEVRGNNEIHLIGPCGDDRYFDTVNAADLVRRLRTALSECGYESETATP